MERSHIAAFLAESLRSGYSGPPTVGDPRLVVDRCFKIAAIRASITDETHREHILLIRVAATSDAPESVANTR